MLLGKRIWITVITLALLLSGTARAADVVDRIVAVVNGDIITLFDLNQRMKPMLERIDTAKMTENEKRAVDELRKKILDRMIGDLLISQECARLKITVTDTELQNSIKQFKEQNNLTEDKLLEQLKLEGMTRADFEKKMRDDMLRSQVIGYMVRHKVLVTRDEIMAYFNAHKSDYAKDNSLRLALILLPSGADADGLRGQIASGKTTFAQAAKEHSVGPNADKGGDLGSYAWKDISPVWREAIKDLQPGEVSQPFMVEDQSALLEVLGRDNGSAGELTPDIEAAIYKKIYEPRLEARFDEYMEQLKSKAVIDIKL